MEPIFSEMSRVNTVFKGENLTKYQVETPAFN